MNGTIALPSQQARAFKQQYESGLIRPQIQARPNGEIIKVALVNDAENSLLELENGEFITAAERKRRVAEAEQERATVGEMVRVPAGCFSPAGTQVCLDAFRIGKYEATQGQWKNIMGSNPSSFSSCGKDCPVENVSWNDVQSFIEKLNNQTGKKYRLPTEAEWQYACTSGGKNEEYCGGNDLDAVAWYDKDKNSGSKTHPVGQKQPNGLGIYDMSGNVWEWVGDWYDSSYPSGSSNPTGPSSGSSRVNRGGSWGNFAAYARASYRNYFNPDYRYNFLGFRLVSPVQ
jgi:formylglycine-generating enzyme required for sulfatase activity